jgi:hypothetical protein
MSSDNHKCPTTVLADDLQWWILFLADSAHCRLLWDSHPTVTIECDASQHAGGAFCHSEWFYTAWCADLPGVNDSSINIKELVIVVSAAYRWAASLRNHRVVFCTDNAAVKAILNKGTSISPAATAFLRFLSLLAIHHNFAVSAVHVPGIDNNVPDAISRLHLPGQLQRLGRLLYDRGITSFLPCHMSDSSLYFLLSQVANLY